MKRRQKSKHSLIIFSGSCHVLFHIGYRISKRDFGSSLKEHSQRPFQASPPMNFCTDPFDYGPLKVKSEPFVFYYGSIKKGVVHLKHHHLPGKMKNPNGFANTGIDMLKSWKFPMIRCLLICPSAKGMKTPLEGV